MHANLTVLNPNENTILQSVSMGGTVRDDDKPYTGEASLNLHAKMHVRAALTTAGTSESTVTLSNPESFHYFLGDVSGGQNSTLNLKGNFAPEITVQGFQNINLQENSTLSPNADSTFQNVSIPENATLNLRNYDNAELNILGNFIGGGTLKFAAASQLNIKGTVSGTTKVEPGLGVSLFSGIDYITAPNANGNEFTSTNSEFTFKSQRKAWSIGEKESLKINPSTIVIQGTKTMIKKEEMDGDAKYTYTVSGQYTNGAPIDDRVWLYGYVVNKQLFDASTHKIGTSFDDLDADLAVQATSMSADIDGLNITLKKADVLLGKLPEIALGNYYIIVGDQRLDKIVGKFEFTVYDGELSSKVNMDTAKISFNQPTFIYTGREIKPTVKVEIGDKVLQEGTDYKVSYQDNVNITDSAKVIITGINGYTSTKTATFKIVSAPSTGTEGNTGSTGGNTEEQHRREREAVAQEVWEATQGKRHRREREAVAQEVQEATQGKQHRREREAVAQEVQEATQKERRHLLL